MTEPMNHHVERFKSIPVERGNVPEYKRPFQDTDPEKRRRAKKLAEALVHVRD